MAGKEIIVGIDPGLTGGIAIFENGVPTVHDMPVIADRTGGKNSVDIDGVMAMLPPTAKIVIERQQAMQKQGVASTFQTGLNYGKLLGLIVALAYEHEIVAPSAWAKVVGKPAKTGKEWNVAEARRRWPHLKDVLLKSKDGRSDALLIGSTAVTAIVDEPEPETEEQEEFEPVVLPDW